MSAQFSLLALPPPSLPSEDPHLGLHTHPIFWLSTWLQLPGAAHRSTARVTPEHTQEGVVVSCTYLSNPGTLQNSSLSLIEYQHLSAAQGLNSS